MKASTFIKTIIVIAAIATLGYIIYNSNKAAEITSLVSKPIEQYDFSLHVDSACADIRSASDYSNAKEKYNALYEEMDVYSRIYKDDGEHYINDSTQKVLFTNAIDACWPFYQNTADKWFQSTDWKYNRNFYEDLVVLQEKSLRGCQTLQTDSLYKYLTYLYNYNRFKSLLNSLENCTSARTYKRLSERKYYQAYPYSNLIEYQNRSQKAPSMAQQSWKQYLMNQKNDIQREGDYLGKQSYIRNYDLDDFWDKYKRWKKEVISYEINTRDNETFEDSKKDIQIQYEQLSRKLSF